MKNQNTFKNSTSKCYLDVLLQTFGGCILEKYTDLLQHTEYGDVYGLTKI